MRHSKNPQGPLISNNITAIPKIYALPANIVLSESLLQGMSRRLQLRDGYATCHGSRQIENPQFGVLPIRLSASAGNNHATHSITSAHVVHARWLSEF